MKKYEDIHREVSRKYGKLGGKPKAAEDDPEYYQKIGKIGAESRKRCACGMYWGHTGKHRAI
jgi:hypothetical protein